MGAVAEVRTKVWRRAAATTGTGTVVLDIDGSLHQVHSENKEEAAANYKGGYGFHPIYCFADATGETLAVALRPGNAGANNIADHVALLDAAITGLPAEIAVGYRAGDDPSLVCRPIQVRTDSARRTDFVWHARNRNVGFAGVARSNDHGAVTLFEGLLVPATGSLQLHQGSWSIEVPLAPFSADDEDASDCRPGTAGPSIIRTSMRLEGIGVPAHEVDALTGRTFDFPTNPEPGYIDGSIYLGAAHNPVDVRRLQFGEIAGGRLAVLILGTIVFEYELRGTANHDFELDATLRIGDT